MLATVRQVVPQNWKGGTVGKYLGETIERFVNVWRQFGEDFANIWWTFGKMFAKYSRNNRHLRHLFIKQLPNNLEFADSSPRLLISHQMFVKRSPFYCRIISEFAYYSPIFAIFVTKCSLIFRQLFASCRHTKINSTREQFVPLFANWSPFSEILDMYVLGWTFQLDHHEISILMSWIFLTNW